MNIATPNSARPPAVTAAEDPWRGFRTPVPDASPVEPEPAYEPFPIDSLPPVMARFAAEVARTICVDPALAALPMLSVAGAAVGNTARARMSADYLAPAVIWSAPITRSGERKSPVLRAVMRPIYEA